MSQRAIRIGLTVLVLGASFGGLLAMTLRDSTQYYKHVDEVMVAPSDWHGKSLQLHGFVVKDSILVNKNALEYRFKVHNNGMEVPATYTGIVPDTFKEEAEVVLKGTLRPDGFHVEPNGVMAKCPSKYEPKKGVPTS